MTHHGFSAGTLNCNQTETELPDAASCQVPSTLLMSLLHVRALPWTWLVPMETLGLALCEGRPVFYAHIIPSGNLTVGY
jgi:hypothetical protein